ncbi:MAG: cell wall-active antibiotics response protein [Propionibacteriaceae bacterium]|jgi:hypothetical protein|nr:cell wall-active antibiotics response protein [Propionibacteriaceae bacterium]
MTGTDPDPAGFEPLNGPSAWRIYPDAAAAAGPLEPEADLREVVWAPEAVPPAPAGVSADLYQAWRQAVSAGQSEDNPMVIQPGSGQVKREGSWSVPPYLLLRGGMGSIELDFRQAVPLSPVVVVDVRGGLGTIKLLLPAGWAAHGDGLARGLGSCRIKVEDTPAAGLPLLIVRGRLDVGSFTVRHPTAREDRKLAKRLARQAEKLARRTAPWR